MILQEKKIWLISDGRTTCYGLLETFLGISFCFWKDPFNQSFFSGVSLTFFLHLLFRMNRNSICKTWERLSELRVELVYSKVSLHIFSSSGLLVGLYSLNDFMILFLFCNTELGWDCLVFMTSCVWVGEGIPELVISKVLSVGRLWMDDTGQIPATSGHSFSWGCFRLLKLCQSCLFDPGMFWDGLVELLYKSPNEIQEASPNHVETKMSCLAYKQMSAFWSVICAEQWV